MYRLNTVFKPYCLRHGIQLLRDDILFLEHALNKVPSERHKGLLRRYCQEWLYTLKENDKSCSAQNMGRRAANIWLREYVGL